ncbi:MAG TPA: hypothetical protein DF383_04635, partial [Deltaproteobacteria bacterium]|nr:hypothetical protein [Deltaproteobacteria bacterium]
MEAGLVVCMARRKKALSPEQLEIAINKSTNFLNSVVDTIVQRSQESLQPDILNLLKSPSVERKLTGLYLIFRESL